MLNQIKIHVKSSLLNHIRPHVHPGTTTFFRVFPPRGIGVVLQLRVGREDHEIGQAEDDHCGILKGKGGSCFMGVCWR